MVLAISPLSSPVEGMTANPGKNLMVPLSNASRSPAILATRRTLCVISRAQEVFVQWWRKCCCVYPDWWGGGRSQAIVCGVEH